MLTMLEATPGPVPHLNDCERAYYTWEIPDVTDSASQALADDDGWWADAEKAYADLTAWLHEGKMPVLPSAAQIVVHVDYWPAHVSHVVRIG